MNSHSSHKLAVFAFLMVASFTPLHGLAAPSRNPKVEIGYVQIDREIALRRMVAHSAAPKGSVLLLHGFPETLHAWQKVVPILGEHYDVHAFDWPGYGLSSRPASDRFGYSPKDYARVLKQYIDKARIDSTTLTIYATDIGALPALLLALDEPDIARRIIVGDFAPFDRPAYLYETLRNLKSATTAPGIRVHMNANRAEILENAFRRGLPQEAQFELSPEFKDDIARGWQHGELSSADAFYFYYAHFTRDQNFFEANLARLETPVSVIWGERDLYIQSAMGVEFAQKAGTTLFLLPGVGHYPHLQSPAHVIEEVRASFQ